MVASVVLVAHLVAQTLVKTAGTVVAAFNPGYHSHPGIFEFDLRCSSPRELSWLAMSIAVTPGSLVLATALAKEGMPAKMFVHILNSRGREIEVAQMRQLESRILAVTRGSDAG